MRGTASVLVATIMLAGCTGGTTDDDVDPFSGRCDFPQVEPGGNNFLVGGAYDQDREPVQGVDVRAAGQGDAADVRDTTNQGGCYFLSMDVGVTYDVTWSKAGHRVHQLADVEVPAGEKRILHIELRRI